MKKLYVFFIFLLLLIFSCNKSTAPEEKGNIPLLISLQPAFEHGYDVTKVEAILSKEDYTNSIYLTIEGDSASGEFKNLEPGIYNITINIYDHDNLIATGSETAEVIANQTTIVHITIHFIEQTGDIVVIVDWVVDKNFPDSLLFVGNSYTYVNGGLDVLLKRFAESAHPEWIINTSKIAYGEYTLEDHYYNPTTMATIRYGKYDYVILQEKTERVIEETDSMYYYTTLLNTIIDSIGAKTVLFMPWTKQNEPQTIQQISQSYLYIANELNAYLIPVGIAFENARLTAPQINLYSSDQIHPSPYGTYLTVCTFYAFLYDENPIGVQYCNVDSISENDKITLQKIAWETYNQYLQ